MQQQNTMDGAATDKWGAEDMQAAVRIFLIAAQLAVLILITRVYNILDGAFLEVSLFVLGGFLIHAFLPLSYRLPFFSLLSIASIFSVLGLTNGLWLFALGFLLIGICHIPISLLARVGILVLVCGVLTIMRVDYHLYPSLQTALAPLSPIIEFSGGLSSAIWPILGSMFMFRLIIYLYDLHHAKERPGIWQTISYFFMIPNVCFPLFPVVDFKKFHRSHYSEEAWRTYQRGILWIYRGVVHLILYRFVYLYMTLDPIDVNGLTDMLQYSLAAFLLYLQVSGQFHLIVGMLLLFGFNLPETHHYYYLASSFTDFWRRINIYWKDFMMKIFYYPLQYRLRKLGDTKALVIATLVVFLTTWVLHMYQWFWLRGSALLEWHDALFWGLLGVLVIGNSLYEMKYGRARSLGKGTRTVYDRAATLLSTIATFTAICLLWGMWSSDSLSQWISMWETTGMGWAIMLFLIPALYITSLVFNRIAKRKQKTTPRSAASLAPPAGFWRLATPTVLSILVVYSLGQPVVYEMLPTAAANAFHGARFKLNERDRVQQERGYYEDLIAINRQNTELWDLYSKKPKDWDWAPGSQIRTGDFLEYSYAPNMETMFKGAMVTTNSQGLRDREYELTPPPGVHRIAVLGASHTFGSGVSNDENFEALVEDRLNREKPAGPAVKYESLNFARGGRVPLHQIMILEQIVLPYKPDTVIYVGHHKDRERTSQHLARQFKSGIEIPYPYIQSVLEKAGVNRNMKRFDIERKLKPYEDELLEWSYKQMVDICRKHNITPVWVLLPMTTSRLLEEDVIRDIETAETAGFAVITLEDVYAGIDPTDLVIAPWDNHPNADAHKLVAELLYQQLLEQPDLLVNR